jgi:4-amino-4-deoxy-L-arabinose transferase-like glycosyltransferase
MSIAAELAITNSQTDTGPPMPRSKFWNSPLAMLLVGLVIRLIASAFAYRDLLDPWRDHWEFGWETGRIAHSLATGHGFASPLYGAEGPTAWMGPVYPFLLSIVFRLFGSFTTSSAVAILALNSVFSALICVPVYFIAKRVFGDSTAMWTGWIWALYPYAIYFAASRVWETSLTALLFTLAVWMTYVLADEMSLGRWIFYAAVWAITSLTSPVTLVALPLMLAWIWHRNSKTAGGRVFAARASMFVLVFLALVSPWLVRNYRTFHRFIPFRDNLWLEFWVGNNGDTSDVYIDSAHPAHSSVELDEYRRYGEPVYFDRKKTQVLDFIRTHPGMFAWLTVRRFTFTWTGFWSLSPNYLKNEPFEIPNVVVSSALTILMLIGMRQAWRSHRISSLPSIFCLISIPAVYYLTHVDPNYRHPVDPEIILFAVCGIAAGKSGTIEAQRKEAAVTAPA